MMALMALVAKVAPTDTPVLIRGESGTGKELIANAIHANSPRRKRRFVAINCASIPETLLESELFGHEKGSFTGADRTKPGLMELADGGTLFLDEIGDLPLSLQAKVLRRAAGARNPACRRGAHHPRGFPPCGGDEPRPAGGHGGEGVPDRTSISG